MVIELTVLDLALAALLILALAGVSLRLGLGIGQRLVVSAAAGEEASCGVRPSARRRASSWCS